MDDTATATAPAADKKNPFTAVPIEVTVCVGKARPLVRDLVQMGENDLLALDSRVDDPVELFVGERLIARGMLQEADEDPSGQLVVRLTEILQLQPDS